MTICDITGISLDTAECLVVVWTEDGKQSLQVMGFQEARELRAAANTGVTVVTWVDIFVRTPP